MQIKFWFLTYFSPRISYGHWSVMSKGKLKHGPELGTIPGCQNNKIRYLPEIGYVEDTAMCRSVFSNDTSSINSKNNRKVLEAYIMYYLVKSPLEKGWVDSNDR